MPPVNPIAAALTASVAAIGSLVVGLGLITSTVDGLAVAAAGTIIATGFLIANSIHHTAAAKVRVAEIEHPARRAAAAPAHK